MSNKTQEIIYNVICIIAMLNLVYAIYSCHIVEIVAKVVVSEIKN